MTSITKIGNYLLHETIGRGSFGKVKRAEHTETGDNYAVKLMKKPSVEDKNQYLRVRREIAIMKALHHRNVVKLYDVLASNVRLYIVMEHVEGGNLLSTIGNNIPYSVREDMARFYFRQILDGLIYCHKKGVYHRDLKLENILITKNHEVKITDFGLSSFKVEDPPNDLLMTKCGTPSYVAPEIISEKTNKYSGAKVDAWAAGVILYTLLAGCLPYKADNVKTIYKKIENDPVKYPDYFCPDAIDLLQNLLQKDPTVRSTLEQIGNAPWLTNYPMVSPEKLESQLKEATKRGAIDVLSAKISDKLLRNENSKTASGPELGNQNSGKSSQAPQLVNFKPFNANDYRSLTSTEQENFELERQNISVRVIPDVQIDKGNSLRHPISENLLVYLKRKGTPSTESKDVKVPVNRPDNPFFKPLGLSVDQQKKEVPSRGNSLSWLNGEDDGRFTSFSSDESYFENEETWENCAKIFDDTVESSDLHDESSKPVVEGESVDLVEKEPEEKVATDDADGQIADDKDEDSLSDNASQFDSSSQTEKDEDKESNLIHNKKRFRKDNLALSRLYQSFRNFSQVDTRNMIEKRKQEDVVYNHFKTCLSTIVIEGPDDDLYELGLEKSATVHPPNSNSKEMFSKLLNLWESRQRNSGNIFTDKKKFQEVLEILINDKDLNRDRDQDQTYLTAHTGNKSMKFITSEKSGKSLRSESLSDVIATFHSNNLDLFVQELMDETEQLFVSSSGLFDEKPADDDEIKKTLNNMNLSVTSSRDSSLDSSRHSSLDRPKKRQSRIREVSVSELYTSGEIFDPDSNLDAEMVDEDPNEAGANKADLTVFDPFDIDEEVIEENLNDIDGKYRTGSTIGNGEPIEELKQASPKFGSNSNASVPIWEDIAHIVKGDNIDLGEDDDYCGAEDEFFKQEEKWESRKAFPSFERGATFDSSFRAQDDEKFEDVSQDISFILRASSEKVSLSSCNSEKHILLEKINSFNGKLRMDTAMDRGTSLKEKSNNEKLSFDKILSFGDMRGHITKLPNSTPITFINEKSGDVKFEEKKRAPPAYFTKLLGKSPSPKSLKVDKLDKVDKSDNFPTAFTPSPSLKEGKSTNETPKKGHSRKPSVQVTEETFSGRSSVDTKHQAFVNQSRSTSPQNTKDPSPPASEISLSRDKSLRNSKDNNERKSQATSPNPPQEIKISRDVRSKSSRDSKEKEKVPPTDANPPKSSTDLALEKSNGLLKTKTEYSYLPDILRKNSTASSAASIVKGLVWKKNPVLTSTLSSTECEEIMKEIFQTNNWEFTSTKGEFKLKCKWEDTKFSINVTIVTEKGVSEMIFKKSSIIAFNDTKFQNLCRYIEEQFILKEDKKTFT